MYCACAVDFELYKCPAKNVLIEGVLGCRNWRVQAAKNGTPNSNTNSDTDTPRGDLSSHLKAVTPRGSRRAHNSAAPCKAQLKYRNALSTYKKAFSLFI